MRSGKPMTKRSLSDRRGTASSIAFDFGDGVASYSKTSGILSSVGRLGLIVLGGALLLATVLLRQDSQVLHVSEGSAAASTVRGAVDADRTKVTAGSDSSITLQTPHGNIVITLRPDLSSESTQYIHSLINSKSCTAQSCRLYRAEKPGILQGILKSGDEAVERGVGLVKPNTVFGRCPDEYKGVKQDCPEHDRNCGCHGPIMVKGDVGWAAGTAGGPDFFINTYEKPARHWGNQHTVWGHVYDDASLATIAKYWELPVKNVGGMHMLREEVPFRLVASGGKISRMVDSLWSVLN